MNADTVLLWKLFPTISRTFAFTIPQLPQDIALDLAVGYSVCRIIDTVEDSTLDLDKKKKLLNLFFSALQDSNTELMSDFEQESKNVPTSEHYAAFLQQSSLVLRIFSSLPEQTQQGILDCAEEMIEGFTNPDVQVIDTLEDQNKYCHYAAGIVGYLITGLLVHRGYITEEKAGQLKPLSHDFGLALQKVNIIKDVRADYNEGRQYWPNELLKKQEITYEQLFSDHTAAMNVLHDLLRDVEHYIERSFEYIDQLPHEPQGIRIYCANNLLMAVATLHAVDTTDLFSDDADVKISRETVKKIDKKVREFVDKKKDLREIQQSIKNNDF